MPLQSPTHAPDGPGVISDYPLKDSVFEPGESPGCESGERGPSNRISVMFEDGRAGGHGPPAEFRESTSGLKAARSRGGYPYRFACPSAYSRPRRTWRRLRHASVRLPDDFGLRRECATDHLPVRQPDPDGSPINKPPLPQKGSSSLSAFLPNSLNKGRVELCVGSSIPRFAVKRKLSISAGDLR
jgi:hypothetical protein